MYTTAFCPYCHAAKDLLRQKKLEFEEIDVSEEKAFDDLVERTGWKTVPQIFVGDEMIGGFRELNEIHSNGRLDDLLSKIKPS